MNLNLLQIELNFHAYKLGMLCFVTAFVIAMLLVPPLIYFINRYKWFDVPDLRKEHDLPIPTMGGIAVCISMAIACVLWFQFSKDLFIISFFFSIVVLFAVGIMDDMNDMKARNKLVIQLALGSLVA